MNNTRRKQIAALAQRLSGAIAGLEDIRSDIEMVKEEEQEYLENMPESMQDGDKGMNAQAAIDYLEQAYDALSELIDGDAISTLESAAE